MDVQHGYAVIHHDTIDIATVSPTPRAAMVNWLCTGVGILMLNSSTDEEIQETYDRQSKVMGARLVPVLISEKPVKQD